MIRILQAEILALWNKAKNLRTLHKALIGAVLFVVAVAAVAQGDWRAKPKADFEVVYAACDDQGYLVAVAFDVKTPGIAGALLPHKEACPQPEAPNQVKVLHVK